MSPPLNFTHTVLSPALLGDDAKDNVELEHPGYAAKIESVEYDYRTATYTTTFDLTRKLE